MERKCSCLPEQPTAFYNRIECPVHGTELALDAILPVFKECARILQAQGYRDFHEEISWAELALKAARK